MILHHLIVHKALLLEYRVVQKLRLVGEIQWGKTEGTTAVNGTNFSEISDEVQQLLKDFYCRQHPFYIETIPTQHGEVEANNRQSEAAVKAEENERRRRP